MKKVLAIFAHPDDEALGPAGTLATLSKDHEVYLLCVTNGEAAGTTPQEKERIGAKRQEEMQKSASILGIKKVVFLGYEDGKLCNSIYHKLVEDISKWIEQINPDTLVTFEVRGVSGHIDHITVSLVSTYIFNKYSFLKKLMYFVRPKEVSDQMQDYFIFYPTGYRRDEVDEIVSTEKVWDTMTKAMYCHQSQLKDVERVYQFLRDHPKEEYFLVLTK